jgi:hypothetical protein
MPREIILSPAALSQRSAAEEVKKEERNEVHLPPIEKPRVEQMPIIEKMNGKKEINNNIKIKLTSA